LEKCTVPSTNEDSEKDIQGGTKRSTNQYSERDIQGGTERTIIQDSGNDPDKSLKIKTTQVSFYTNDTNSSREHTKHFLKCTGNQTKKKNKVLQQIPDKMKKKFDHVKSTVEDVAPSNSVWQAQLQMSTSGLGLITPAHKNSPQKRKYNIIANDTTDNQVAQNAHKSKKKKGLVGSKPVHLVDILDL
jgi:hypothetical protein